MTKEFKITVLDFAGYPHYLVPYRGQLLPKSEPLGADYHLVSTDYVQLHIVLSDMEPTIRHDSYVRGQIVERSLIPSLTEGVYAAAMISLDGQRIAQIVVGRLKEKPARQLTLWSEGAARLEKKVLLVERVAFLFKLIWTAPKELYPILPR